MGEQLGVNKMNNKVHIQANNSYSVRNLLNLGGNYRDKELMINRARKYTSDCMELKMLERYFYLLVNTDYLHEAVCMYYVDGKSQKQISDKTGYRESYIRNLVYRDVKRLFNDLSVDPYAFVRYPDTNMETLAREKEVDRILKRIELMIKKQELRRYDSLMDYMLIDFSRYGEPNNKFEGFLDEEEYTEFVRRMQYLSKPYLQSFFNIVDKRIPGYIHYLLTTGDGRLTERDRERKKELAAMWLFPSNE